MVWIKVCLYFCHHLQLLYLVLLYNIFIFLFQAGIRLSSIWNAKAQQWLAGRKDVWEELEKAISKDDKWVWIHASSAGEFEQAKPIIEKLKTSVPSYKILVSFFSPSGYSIAGKYSATDHITYLPVDTPNNADRFIKLINPVLVVFIKYDFWYHYLTTLRKMKIPLLLVSAVFRKDQSFFKWYGSFYRKMLFCFTQIFVQDKRSLDLLHANGIKHARVSGDTRFDRVWEIAAAGEILPLIKEFIGQAQSVVAGSTWPDDEKLLRKALASFPKLKLIIAPHEIHAEHINQIQTDFPEAILYSQLKNKTGSSHNKRVLIIDNVGLLSRLYRYATITYVGGGFTRDGIHNCLEAAVYGKPVLFGPNYKKYQEAKELIEFRGGFSVTAAEEITQLVEGLLKDNKKFEEVCSNAASYIETRRGATQKIINYIHENRLLTS